MTSYDVGRWVGISSRNLKASAAALRKAFEDARPGDQVVPSPKKALKWPKTYAYRTI